MALAGASSVVALLALEVALRVVGPPEVSQSFAGLFMPDDRIGFRLMPNASMRLTTSEFDTEIAVNAAGVRDDEIGAKAEDEYRIVVLGDSMVMAAQVPPAQTFCRLLQARLNAGATTPRRIRVINGGVQGYGPVEEYLFYSRVAAGFEPDLVLLVIFVGNDAVEAADAEFRLGAPGATATPIRESPWVSMRRLARRSAVLQWVRLRIPERLGPLGVAPVRQRPVDTYLDDPPTDVLRGFTVAREAARRLVVEATQRGSKTALVLLPARLQVDPDDYRRLSEVASRAGQRLTVDGATTRFRAALGDLGVPMLDLLAELRAVPDPSSLFFAENIHLTARGHGVVGDVLAQFLRSHHLLPESGETSRR